MKNTYNKPVCKVVSVKSENIIATSQIGFGSGKDGSSSLGNEDYGWEDEGDDFGWGNDDDPQAGYGVKWKW